jgi:hypothetical protein
MWVTFCHAIGCRHICINRSKSTFGGRANGNPPGPAKLPARLGRATRELKNLIPRRHNGRHDSSHDKSHRHIRCAVVGAWQEPYRIAEVV